ncbi:phytoene desaturase [Kocuria varians]|uniref:Phytoene desaturase n=1 Tax=Kocuria varians TaxID=1272 RepID=A0A4Y4D689_KOCVA|nr:phytoene desaturase family protein [Kocuria varians]GED00137.1 phytoene desaturase [Kocuria varians]
MTRAVVIGGGFAGLATAGLLTRDGHRVTLLEQQDTVGGRSGRWSAEGFTFDTGPSWYLMPEVIDRWFRLMGSSTAERLDLRRLTPGYRTFFEHHLDEPPTDVVTGAAEELFDRLDPGSSRALRAYLDSGAEVYELAKKHFLYTNFEHPRELLHPSVLARLPRLAGLLSTSMQRYIARRFPEPRERQLLGYPAVFLGASPGSAPAMYHLMSHLDLTDGVQYPVGGFAALVDAMADLVRAAGVEIVTGATVTGIEVDPARGPARARLRSALPGGRPTGVVTGVTYRPGGVVPGAENTVPADLVVGAADLHHLQTRLLPQGFRAPESRWTRRDPGPSGVLVCLGVRGKLPELAHHNLLFTADWDENFDRIAAGAPLAEETSIYVSMTSATDPGTAPEGDENLFILVPSPATPEWGRGGISAPGIEQPGSPRVEEVADRAIDQLARWAGIPDLAARIVVRRTYGPGDFVSTVNAWRGSLLGPGHTLGQSAMFRPGVRDPGIKGLFYAGSSVRPGIGVPMCLISSEVVRDAVRESGAH